MIRSVLAVVAGIVMLTLTSFSIEWAVAALVPAAQPETMSTGLRIFTMAYTLLCIAAGGYAAAYVAGREPLKHALVFGIVQALMTAAVWMSGAAPGNSPAWLWIVGIALTVPMAWWGGTMQARTT